MVFRYLFLSNEKYFWLCSFSQFWEKCDICEKLGSEWRSKYVEINLRMRIKEDESYESRFIAT